MSLKWIEFKKTVPQKQDNYLIAVRHKNKEDGIIIVHPKHRKI